MEKVNNSKSFQFNFEDKISGRQPILRAINTKRSLSAELNLIELPDILPISIDVKKCNSSMAVKRLVIPQCSWNSVMFLLCVEIASFFSNNNAVRYFINFKSMLYELCPNWYGICSVSIVEQIL
jgi:hypothetical protein